MDIRTRIRRIAIGSSEPRYGVFKGDALKLTKLLHGESVHAVVQDPPGGGDYLKKEWDGLKGGTEEWIAWMAAIQAAVLDVVLPGGYSLTWCYHNTVGLTEMALRRAGWEIIDTYIWYHGQGTCTGSLDCAKAIESLLTFGSSSNKLWHKLPGKRIVKDNSYSRISDLCLKHGCRKNPVDHKGAFILEPTTKEAAKWMGWQTRVMSHGEPWILARKPLAEATIPENLLKYGVGALNIDGCRINGVYPGNVLHFPKATVAEKEAGLDALPAQEFRRRNPGGLTEQKSWAPVQRRNPHATVKPIELMRWLVRHVCPPDGVVLDPFAGSGSTGCAAVLEGMRFIGFELDQANEGMCDIAMARIRYWAETTMALGNHPDQLSLLSIVREDKD